MKKILITGASSGFGKAIAKELSSKGHKVVGTSRKPPSTENGVELIRLDVTIGDEVEEAVINFIEEHQRIDVLINNAGFGIAGPIESTSMEEAKSQLDCNFFGAVRMIQHVLPQMRKQESGLIINIGSIGGQIGLPFQGFYSASKFALEGLTESLRIELNPFNINVTNVNPGDFVTNFTKNRQIIARIPDIYRNKFDAALHQYEEDENSGSDPKILAKFMARIVEMDGKPRVRYLAGQAMQKIAVKLKKIIGSKTLENMMMKTYHQK